MRREAFAPRSDWKERLAAIDFHIGVHADGRPYWREDACYVLSEAEVEMFHAAAQAAQQMIDVALARVFAEGRLVSQLGLPPAAAKLAQDSRSARQPSLYGRFDFLWDGAGEPVLIEFNADTPTALYEAAVVQWRWLADRDADGDQYNLIQEKLIERWPVCAAGACVHFASQRDLEEDLLTAEYLRECASAAGVETRALDISEIGWSGEAFVDLDGAPIEALFKLYPTEWLATEDFGPHLGADRLRLIEPAWRLAASSKGLLAVLWEMFPASPHLVAASMTAPASRGDVVEKPVLGREGAGVRFGRREPAYPAVFDNEPRVYQQRVRAKRFGGFTPVFGVWMIGGEPCGLGVREDESEITGPNACFAPHRIG